MDLKINKKKFEVFLKVAEELNRSLDIIPILYGSLGLYKIIGEYGECNDIDILVPDEFVNGKWNELINLMKKTGFELKDEYEHKFICDSEIVAFGKQDDLTKRIGLDPDNLKVSKVGGAKFKELSVEDYLFAYKLILRDSSRQEKKGKADQEKIAMIQKYLRAKNRRINEK